MLMQFFPVPVAAEELSLDLPAITEYVYGLKKRNVSAYKSNRGGWQSKPLIGEHPPLLDLRNAIKKHGENYRKIIGYKNPITIKNMWVNINGYKDCNMEHTHPNSIISGVFYVKVSGEKFGDGLLEFSHPSVHIMEGDWESDLFEPNQFNNLKLNLQPTANQLVFFPNWLVHAASQNLSKTEDRISISFNLG
tara:strand:+ start:363 stop:938 length:576 start_codon:yes stop_codon:yes gene_type:complete